MCLSKILPLPRRLPTAGWKVFRTTGSNNLKRRAAKRAAYDSLTCGGLYREGVWYSDDNPQEHLLSEGTPQYKAGFHMFLTRRSAQAYCAWWEGVGKRNASRMGKNFVVRKVYIEDVVALGEQHFEVYSLSPIKDFGDRSPIKDLGPAPDGTNRGDRGGPREAISKRTYSPKCVVARKMLIVPEVLSPTSLIGE